MLVDLTQNAVVGIVALSRSVLARDISVPFDFLDRSTHALHYTTSLFTSLDHRIPSPFLLLLR